jgi:oligosaccharide repeat unit polymerase
MYLAAFIMILLTVLAGFLAKMKLTPATILCGSWSMVFLLQSFFAADMYSSIKATAAIFCISSSFVVGEVFGHAICVGDLNGGSPAITRKRDFFDRKMQFRFGLVVVLMGLFAIIGSLQYAKALGLFEVSSLEEAMVATGIARTKLMSDQIQVGVLDKIGFLFSYSGVVLSTVYWYFFGWRWWLSISSLAVLMSGIAQAGRAGTLIILLQWIIIIVLKVKVTGNSKNLKKVANIFVLLFVIFFMGQMLREGFSSAWSDSAYKTLHSLRGYLFGGVSAFAFYVDNLMSLFSITYGKYSFSSLFAALGIAPQEVGIYDQYVPISNEQGEVTNVYSAYRSFVDDFTILGACSFYIFSGIFIGYLYFRFIRGNELYIAILVPSISWLAFSPLASLTYFNSFLLSVFLPYIILIMLFRTKKTSLEMPKGSIQVNSKYQSASS